MGQLQSYHFSVEPTLKASGCQELSASVDCEGTDVFVKEDKLLYVATTTAKYTEWPLSVHSH